MVKQGCFVVLMTLVLSYLTGCLGGVWTGANLVYERHHVYKKLDDYRLYLKVNNAIMVDTLFKNNFCVLDITVFNGDILIVGHVPTDDMQKELRRRISTVKGYRHLSYQVGINVFESNALQDTWITTRIRSQIFADDSIDPHAFKVVTFDKVVYLMGEVYEEQALKVIDRIRHTSGVKRVVKMLRYYKQGELST